ncbi:MAG: hydroxymethylbilane synthase [Gammaproteobacteria bacterium]|nr:hydroxymethylbilane synthase [Gammaproteobacteria bacterium]NND60826.1 hydroxymethylbilane synthase [Gammaproteobacteria bacterium]
MMHLRIATRQSRLALWQSEHVADLLRTAHAQLQVELVPMTTQGDERLDVSLAKIGGKGLFIKELEHAMIDGRADIAVHSMKDVPAELPDGFCIAAILERHDPRDVLAGTALDALPEGARVGTSSLRRAAQLRLARPDLRIEPIRGNVETRLAKLTDQDFDAIVLALAGLERLGLDQHVADILPAALCLPAAGQGAIGIECREDNGDLLTLLQAIEHEPTRRAVTAEREVTATLAANCTSPLAAHAWMDETEIVLHSILAHPDGSDAISATARGPDAIKVGREAANRMLRHGARSLLDSVEATYGH